jgi:hypothetical protein
MDVGCTLLVGVGDEDLISGSPKFRRGTANRSTKRRKTCLSITYYFMRPFFSPTGSNSPRDPL